MCHEISAGLTLALSLLDFGSPRLRSGSVDFGSYQMTNRSWLLYSGSLNRKVQTLAEALAELKSLRVRVQRAEARRTNKKRPARQLSGRRNDNLSIGAG